MFWLPYGWFPYYAEWIISFPRAPLGSVSIASWQLACTGIIALVSDALRGAIPSGQKQKQPIPVPAKTAKAGKDSKASEEKVEEKKEL